MYYRRKILLSLLDLFGQPLSNTQLHKYLFLITRDQTKPSFDFVPYKYGCYSFQLNSDLNTMTKYEQVLNEEKKWRKIDSKNYFLELKKEDQYILKAVKNQFGSFDLNNLIRHTYLKFPFYAINSSILEKILSIPERRKIIAQKEKLRKNKQSLFTIGYEGISLEHYLKKLIINDVSLLCDVRKNPISMKNGFSKNQLKNACTKLSIDYIHIPDLGIVSSKRKELKTINDYKILFDDYEKTILEKSESKLEELKNLITKNNRIALTCFEATSCMCHRGRITDFLQKDKTFNIPITHL